MLKGIQTPQSGTRIGVSLFFLLQNLDAVVGGPRSVDGLVAVLLDLVAPQVHLQQTAIDLWYSRATARLESTR